MWHDLTVNKRWARDSCFCILSCLNVLKKIDNSVHLAIIENSSQVSFQTPFYLFSANVAAASGANVNKSGNGTFKGHQDVHSERKFSPLPTLILILT